MKTYTIHNNSEILRIISTTEDGIVLNVGDGESYVEGEFLDEYYYVINSEIKSFPEKPDYPCTFDRSTEQWVWDDASSWGRLKLRRDELLQASDWTQVPDAPVDHAAWATYRQELRDLPANTPDPRNVVWPTPPA